MTSVARRWQPLVALVALLASWAGARTIILTWPGAEQSGAVPLAGAPPAHSPAPAKRQVSVAATNMALPVAAARPAETPASSVPAWPQPSFAAGRLPGPRVPLAPNPAVSAGPQPVVVTPAMPAILPSAPIAATPPQPATARVSAGHQLLWMAGLAHLPLPSELLARRNPVAAARFSADGWLLWRRDASGGTVAGFGLPTYGASQVGAVVRYRLAPASRHRPALYLRASSALDRPRGEEAALGLAARPLAAVPLAVMAEARVTVMAGRARLRPAIAAVTELPPIRLPLGLRGEVYAQAGYVGGAGASPFVDGQARVERPIARIGRAELRAGTAAWGGAQRDASRLDLGPTAGLDLRIGSANARLSADWRFRVAGTAQPRSGPAVTLSAGF